jgi:hypothetical protein
LSRTAKRRLQPYAFFALFLSLFCIHSSHADPHEEIFEWVAAQMNVRIRGHMPQIRLVGKKHLCTVFAKNNQRSYLRWKARYGELLARKILDLYLREILGLYDPATNTIYVSKELGACRRQSIIAHELTHFFQYQTQKIKQPSDPTADAQRLQMENEAHLIEYRYIQLHCPGLAIKQPK